MRTSDQAAEVLPTGYKDHGPDSMLGVHCNRCGVNGITAHRNGTDSPTSRYTREPMSHTTSSPRHKISTRMRITAQLWQTHSSSPLPPASGPALTAGDNSAMFGGRSRRPVAYNTASKPQQAAMASPSPDSGYRYNCGTSSRRRITLHCWAPLCTAATQHAPPS